VTLIIRGEYSTDGGCGLERIRGSGGLVGPPPNQCGIYTNPEGVCRDHGEKGMGEHGDPCSRVMGLCPEARSDAAPRRRANKIHVVIMGKRRHTPWT